MEKAYFGEGLERVELYTSPIFFGETSTSEHRRLFFEKRGQAVSSSRSEEYSLAVIDQREPYDVRD